LLTQSQQVKNISNVKSLKVQLATGLCFEHPVGLAAGFDKNAELLDIAQDLGFSFIEVGTVTPKAQIGNDKPRLFRVPSKEALFNRMGFNNKGSEYVFHQLKKFKEKQKKSKGKNCLKVGVNIGKNKDTPMDLAPQDYALLARKFAFLADYLVVNVSSPNTAGLRDLQELKKLEPIVKSVLAEARSATNNPCPIFLKLAPELSGEVLKETIQATETWGIQGFVLSNTLAGEHQGLQGGWSGALLRDIGLNNLKLAREVTQLPLISVGGIMNEADAQTRLREGAALVQIYSGWIYRGPSFPSEIVKSLL
jgi:dihydroorotate dehydrogenase